MAAFPVYLAARTTLPEFIVVLQGFRLQPVEYIVLVD